MVGSRQSRGIRVQGKVSPGHKVARFWLDWVLLKVFGDQVKHQPRDAQLAAGAKSLAILAVQSPTSSLLVFGLIGDNKSRPLRFSFSLPCASSFSVSAANPTTMGPSGSAATRLMMSGLCQRFVMRSAVLILLFNCGRPIICDHSDERYLFQPHAA